MPTIHIEASELSGLSHAKAMLRQIDSRNRESFPYSREVHKHWGGLEPMLTWCKAELTGDWRWQLIDMATDQRPGRYCFFFDSERDVVAFTMKWC